MNNNKLKSTANRLTGFGLTAGPIGVSASWTPGPDELKIASAIITFLEDRRVLYSPSEMEEVNSCVRSIDAIRTRLTSAMEELDRNSRLWHLASEMRAACRKFMDSIPPWDVSGNRFFHSLPLHEQWTFGSSLGELRGIFGVYLILIRREFGIDVKGNLASILPNAPKDSD